MPTCPLPDESKEQSTRPAGQESTGSKPNQRSMPSRHHADGSKEACAEYGDQDFKTTRQQSGCTVGDEALGPTTIEKIVEQIKHGLEQVTSQLEIVANTAHEENKRNFEAQEQTISELFGDMKRVVSGLRESLVKCIMAHGRVEGTHEGRKYSPEGVNFKAPGNAADSKIHGKWSVQGGIKKDMPPWYEDNGQGIREEDVAVND